MRSVSILPSEVPSTHASAAESYDDCICLIRSRLNVIGTSLYLLEAAIDPDDTSRRYIEKINRELEAIRKLING